MGPLGPGHIGGCRPGAARSAGFRKVSAGRPWGCVGDVEGIMNGGVAIAFLPKFAGFPSLRGLHSSIVQPRRALVRGRRAPVRRVSRPEPGRTGARNSGRSRKGSQSRAVTDATPGRAEVVLQAGNAARIPRSRPTGVRPVIRPGSPEHDNAGPAPRCGPRLQWIRPPRGEDSGPSPAVRTVPVVRTADRPRPCGCGRQSAASAAAATAATPAGRPASAGRAAAAGVSPVVSPVVSAAG